MSLKQLCCVLGIEDLSFRTLTSVCRLHSKVGASGESERERLSLGFVGLARTRRKSRPASERGFRVK